MNIKKGLKKFWFILWKDNSLKGWVITLIVLFIFIKFILFPVLNLATGTSLPLAIVESCSMYHKGDLFSDFDKWWEKHTSKYDKFLISKEEFSEFKMKDGFNKGDILLITKVNPDKLKIGDIIVFDGEQNNPIIHRIIEISESNGEKLFSTIGDNNNGQFYFEKDIQENKIIGKATSKVAPLLGWIKLIFFEAKKSPAERGTCSER